MEELAIGLVYSRTNITLKVAGAAVLASLSVIMQILPPLFVTPWFMRLDFVAVPWVLCWMLFGFEAGLLSLLISVPLVGVLGPFAGGLVGAVMKAVASVWMIVIPALFFWRMKGASFLGTHKRLFAMASVVAIAVRAVVTVLFNLYFALPVFFNLTPDMTLEFFTSLMSQNVVGRSLGLVGFGAFVGEVAFWNTLQGLIDLYVAFVIGFVVLRRVPVAQATSMS